MYVSCRIDGRSVGCVALVTRHGRQACSVSRPERTFHQMPTGQTRTGGPLPSQWQIRQVWDAGRQAGLEPSPEIMAPLKQTQD
jgi:hypothetical protein